MGATLARATVRTNYGVLRAILGAAVDADMLAVSPCRGVRLPVAKPVRPMRFLSAEQLARLAEEMPAQYCPMVYLAGVMGMRWSEVAGLRVGRLDFLRRTLAVTETRGEVDGRVSVAAVNPGVAADAGVPMFLVDLLAEHLASRGRPGPDDFVFVAPHGGALRRSTFRTPVCPAARRAGLDGLTFHQLVHSAVGLMVLSGSGGARGSDQAAPRA